MYIKCSFEEDVLILKIEALTTHFLVLKPHLKKEILDSLEDCTEEAQVNVSVSGLIAIGVLEIIY